MITRQRLSTDVHQELLSRLVRGQFAPGQKLKDTELAEQLGVSRTPVREALLRLEREGFLSAQKHLGFSVKGLHESEILEVYPLIKLLESSALEASALPCPVKIGKLKELARALQAEGSDPLRRIEIDSDWHAALIEDCGNRHLMRILADLKRILLRYEYAFMQDETLVAESAAEHDSIVAALVAGEKKQAGRLLSAHWERCSKATLADFLANRVSA